MTFFGAQSDETPRSRNWVHPAILVLGAVIAFAAHFRPWEVGFLEEWPLAADWNRYGGGAFTASYFEWTLSRPLHLLPSLLGLVVGNGSPSGIFAILALVASAQFLVVVWALRPVSRSFWISVALACFFSLHPLWPGGFLQRFLPAQTAALAFAVTMGLLIRWLATGRIRWIVLAAVVILMGYLVYPGPTAAAPLMALAVAVAVDSTWKRRIWAVGAIVGASALMTLYSLVISRLIIPGGKSYEIGNIEVAGVRSIRELVSHVSSTLLTQGDLVLLAVAGVAVLGGVLALTGAVPHKMGWLITATAVASPLTTVVYFGHIGWLSDMARLSYVMSVGLFAALCVWAIASTTRRVPLQNIVVVLLIVASLVGAVRGIQQWQPYIEVQHRLLEKLGPVVHEADGDDVVVVIDRSATLGLEPTFPLQYLASASRVWNHDDTLVWLCYPEGVAVPGGGVLCDPEDTGDDLRLITSVPQGTGTIDIYIGRQDTND
ncbi:hypothetical protein [Microbacterium hydrocarbonoxydans]|uniref:hypothetical protein n=1 Tax=Microbacterium hydrocarbonoxydans TaxID=273678 RepID=UPI003D97520F